MNIGDEVMFSGQRMTITELCGDRAICEWVDKMGVPQKKEYPIAALKTAPKPRKGPLPSRKTGIV